MPKDSGAISGPGAAASMSGGRSFGKTKRGKKSTKAKGLVSTPSLSLGGKKR